MLSSKGLKPRRLFAMLDGSLTLRKSIGALILGLGFAEEYEVHGLDEKMEVLGRDSDGRFLLLIIERGILMAVNGRYDE